VTGVKHDLERLIDELPEDTTWDDVLERVYLHSLVADGLKDVSEGRVFSQEAMFRKYVVGVDEED